jgi:hypothetical protein
VKSPDRAQVAASVACRCLLLAIAVALVVIGPASPLASASQQPVRVDSGLLAGVPGRDPSITVYKGVPFAAPPVGELRWRPPQPPLPWPGVRTADRFGSICPQTSRDPAASISEDCLFLNIWSGAVSPMGPASFARSASTTRPRPP